MGREVRMNSDELMRENAALVTLLKTCRKPDTWTSIANECILEGSAIRILEHRIDPANHPLQYRNDDSAAQGVLLEASGLDASQRRTVDETYRSAQLELDNWQRQGFDFVSLFDDRFPHRLRATIDVPPFLFAKGTLDPDDRGVSVVGSRHCSPEGARFAEECAHMLVGQGLTVVAGLAKGIDTFAHRTALKENGRTVAFIGTGIDRQYPAENRDLQHAIEERGLVLSQFWPGTAPTKQTFPMRNALMSGYSIATIIADAGEYSGTRIQARQAQHHGRPVIINSIVLDKAKWARALENNDDVFIVNDVDGVRDALRQINRIGDQADELIRGLLVQEPVIR